MDTATMIGKPIDQLTPRELAELQSNLATLSQKLLAREVEIKQVSEEKAFGAIAKIAQKQMLETLGWLKLPPLSLVGQDDGTYKVEYVATRTRTAKKTATAGNGTRQHQGLNGGKITIGKLRELLGGIASYKLPDGREFESVQSIVVNGLGYMADDKTPAAYRLMDKKHHNVVLVLTNGTEVTIGDAIAKMAEAREKIAMA